MMTVVADSLTVSRNNRHDYHVSGDHVIDETMNQAKAGTPVQVNGSIPRPSAEPWRMDLGERVVRAAAAKDAMRACGEFYSFGDIVFCKKAMPAETDTARQNRVYSGRNYVVKESIAKTLAASAPRPDDFIALSYGIEGGDLFSEIMSNNYGVKTKLFDCYYAGKDGPAAVPDRNLSSSTPCQHRACYGSPYEMNRVCVDETLEGRAVAKGGRMFEPLSAQLKDQKPLSVFLKMDVEGAEWDTLKKLLDNEEDMSKLRTLNFEIHFNKGNQRTKESLTEVVGIMEKLSKRFAVTGSTIELLHRANLKKFSEGSYGNVEKHAALIYSKQGIPLDQYCISFVNRQLL